MILAQEAAGHTDYRSLAARMGRKTLERRILKQAGLWAREIHQGEGILKMERHLPLHGLIELAFKMTGLWGRARRNVLDLRLETNHVTLPGLPRAFDGFRILQLADLHCDLEPALVDVVLQKLRGLSCDIVVLTGDYHNEIAEKHDLSLDLMGKLIPHLRPPRLAILGNHDFIEKVAFLEAAGLTVLLNEATAVEKDGVRLWFCGVDDPHYFGTHDLARAREKVPAGETAILLSHSPETYAEAARLGYPLMLSGHTHGGQICLPGGFAPIRNAPVPRFMLAGAWRHQGLQGYTSRGTGSCGVAARFFCPPEMTIHILHSAPEN